MFDILLGGSNGFDAADNEFNYFNKPYQTTSVRYYPFHYRLYYLYIYIYIYIFDKEPFADIPFFSYILYLITDRSCYLYLFFFFFFFFKDLLGFLRKKETQRKDVFSSMQIVKSKVDKEREERRVVIKNQPKPGQKQPTHPFEDEDEDEEIRSLFL